MKGRLTLDRFFIIKCKDSYYIVENKGREEIQVVDKDVSAKNGAKYLQKQPVKIDVIFI